MPASHDGVSGEDARRIDEELDREDERARAARRDDRRRLYRSTLPVVAAVFFAVSVVFVWRSFYAMRIKTGAKA